MTVFPCRAVSLLLLLALVLAVAAGVWERPARGALERPGGWGAWARSERGAWRLGQRNVADGRRRAASRVHATEDMAVWEEAMRTHPKKGLPGQNRVSFRECSISPEDRQDCGHVGITEEQCAARECCWSASDPGSPHCYHSIPTVRKVCTQSSEQKADCGWQGIRKEQCLAKGCCWQPISQNNVPWCYETIIFPIFEGECGNPAIAPNIKSRVVNGIPARPHSWPWQVSLQTDGFHFCGGTLVNEQWVVSAAHCEPGFSYGAVEVVLGAHNISGNGSNVYQEVRIAPAMTISHEDFNSLPTGLNDDIMLIKLERPVEFTDAISPACLTESGQEFPDGKPCYTSGWGNLMFMGESPDVLQQVQLPLVSYGTCNQSGWYDGAIHQSMICAGYQEGGRGSCHGDSGGPMVCQDGDRWFLTGAVSWGYGGCAAENYPTVFAKVSYEREWLDKVYSEHV